MIRAATQADVPAIVRMATTFLTSELYRRFITPDPENLRRFASSLIEQDNAEIFVVDDRTDGVVGMLAIVAMVHPMSGQRFASEVAWWINEDKRGGREAIRLLRSAEAWARAQGAESLVMIAPTEHVERFYGKAGYERVESTWQRRLQ
jgi:N-acetylglutamate synthase-like GNAT family acetyltransferase